MTSGNYAEKIIHGAYFPHIDGIRALAVLPVILHHILASLCPGGFAGVDVFFVISGYLITGGILRDLKQNRFSIKNFYYRRIRRIMPAYFILISGVIAAGCVFYYSVPLRDLGDSSIMGSLFSANFYYWIIGDDYFSPTVKASPLLHLWSLSVEEQFYLFIPLLCFIIWRFRRNWLFPTLATLATLSLFGSIYYVTIGAQSQAFYFLHFRAWELLAGSLLAILPILPLDKIELLKTKSRVILSWMGLLMVLVPYALLSPTVPFPGATAIASVIGTILLIRFGNFGPINRLLSSPMLVGTGKISYSLYLWHWPVTVFWKYLVYNQLTIWDYFGMFILSILLSYLSWRFVEMPVRTSPAWTMPRTFAASAAAIILLVSVGGLTVHYQGWPTILHTKANSLVVPINQQRPGFFEQEIRPRLSRKVAKLFGANISPRIEAKDSWFFAFGGSGNYQLGINKNPDVLLIGDSHAGMLQYGLNKTLNEQNIGGEVITRSSTPMFFLNSSECQAVIAYLHSNPSVTKVVLAQVWSVYDEKPDKYHDMYSELEAFALHVKNMNKTLYIATGVPLLTNTPIDIRARLAMIPPREMEEGWNGSQSDSQYNQKQGEINHKLANICQKTDSILIPLHMTLKNGDKYDTIENHNGQIIQLYKDPGHFSPDGSIRASNFIMSYLYPQMNKPSMALR